MLEQWDYFRRYKQPIESFVLGILPEHHSASGRGGGQENSLWRDLKVYQNHAFIISEDNNHGMQIFDLTQLRNVSNPPVTFSESAHYDGIGKAHNIVINEETGFAYAVGAQSGTQCNGGGLHIIDINDPLNPTFAGCFDDDGYSHDAQVVIYNGPDTDYTGQEICFGSNEDKISISNVTDKSNTFSIATASYSGVEYTHQGWLSEDHSYFYTGDELDELNNGGKTKTFVWDVSDLDNPTLVSTFSHVNSTIDHNLYVKGDLIYASNYTSGLRILDTKDVATTGLKEVAFFDTFQQNNSTSFDGTWSNYPYFESGIVIVSDIVNGLFILKHKPEEVVVVDTESPSATSNITNSNIGLSSIDISWDASTDNIGVVGYVIFLDNINNNPVGNTGATSATITGLSPNTSYNIFIQAYDEASNLSDPASINVTTQIDNDAPSIPTNLTSKDISLNSFTVTWTPSIDNHAVAGYKLYLNDTDSEPALVNSKTTYTFENLLEIQHTVYIVAFDESGNESEAISIDVTLEEVVAGLNKNHAINIFPNPFSKNININNLGQKSAISVLNISGIVVFEMDDFTDSKLDLSGLNKGIYIIKITNTEFTHTLRVLKK